MEFPDPSWNPPAISTPAIAAAALQASNNTATTRKRPRSTSPVPPRGRRAKQVLDLPEGSVLAVELRQPEKRIGALNSLLIASSSHDANYALGASAEDVMEALVDIAHECLDWSPHKTADLIHTGTSKDKEAEPSSKYSFISSTAWATPPTEEAAAWFKHCFRRFADEKSTDQIKIVNVIVAILRNMSYSAANLRLLAHSPPILDILIACLYDTGSAPVFSAATTTSSSSGGEDGMTSTNNRGNLALHALQTLVHLAPYLDITGQKLYADKMFLDPTKLDDKGLIPNEQEYGQALVGMMGWGGLHLARKLDTKEDVVVDVDPKHLVELTGDYLASVWSIFSAIARVLTDTKSPRTVVMVALDLLKELLDQARSVVDIPHDADNEEAKDDEEEDHTIPTSRDVMLHIPDGLLDRLVDFLWVPRLGPDSMEYMNPVNNIVSRVSTLKLLMGYDATVDTDLRDRSLDVLVPLLELQPNPATENEPESLSKRLGCKKNMTTRTRLYDALVPILTTTVGRNDAPNSASELLVLLAKREENKNGLDYIQERMLFLASRDHVRVAQLACNHLYSNKNKNEKEEETQRGAGDAIQQEL